MGKFRSKLKGQTKGKRWPKGQSSSSNPETRRHRDIAKSRFFQENLGASSLSQDALRKHDAIQSFKIAPPILESNMEEDESESEATFTYQTADSFASQWSGCTSMSFNRFMKVFRPDSALHKEMLAVLAAIKEVIEEKKGSESPTEYYCALLTTLEEVYKMKDDFQISAVLSLLSMGIKTVPEAVLRLQFENATQKMLHILRDYVNSDNNTVIKSVFGILSHLLRAQERAAWSHGSTIQIFCSMLDPFSIHSKPKWRKAAQHAIAAVVKSPCFEQMGPNIASEEVAKFCEKILETCMGANSDGAVLVASIQAGQTTILHTLGLMKETITSFSKNHIKTCCEIILKLMTLNYPIVTSCGLQVLHSLFSAQNAVVPAKLNAQIISALYEYQPSINDVQPTLAWLAVMQQAHVHLSDVDLALSCTVLQKLFTTLLQMWLSERHEVTSAATHALEILLKDALLPACASEDLVVQNKSKLAKIFNTIELGLGYQYHNVWRQVLHVISVMFEVGGTNCKDMFTTTLKSLAELRDSYKFSYNNELEHAVGAAVRALGPQFVLSVIHLKKENGELNLDRSWLLPVLKENIKSSTIEFFVKDILPLAIYCQKRSVFLAENNDGIGAHSSELLYLQLWNLLPSFCNQPTDIKKSFVSVAQILGNVLSNKKELRLAVMASIRKLINFAKSANNSEDISELSRFAKNYLPIFFNIYITKPVGTEEEGQRLAVLETIRLYISITNFELTEQLFINALEKLTSSSEDPEEIFIKESILDLIRILVPYQTLKKITELYTKCVKLLPEIKSGKEQKKAYRILEEICGSDSQSCKEFVQNNRKEVQSLLKKSLNSAAVSSKGARLRCYNYLIKAQPKLDHDSKLIKDLVPQAILCCKDINVKCRTIAYEVLKTVGERLIYQGHVKEFLALIVAGLAGTSQLISCTVLALASLLHEFSGSLGQENINLILENVSTLAASPTREVVASSLSFIKVYLVSLPSPQVALSLPIIVKSLTSMTEDCKRHFRLKVRDILDRLVRKYGCESLTPHIPESDTVMYKRLRNLRKLNARKKKQKDAHKDDDLSDDEQFLITSKPKSVEEILADSDSEFEDMETDQPKQTKNNKKKVNTWIEEDPDTIIDFKDPTVSSKITATKPGQSLLIQPEKKKDKDRGFKTSSDGRLIIQDDSDDNQSDSDKPKKKKFGISADSDSDDEKSIAETLPLTDRKRKRSAVSSTKSTFSFSTAGSSKYQSGGIGIHRTTGTSNSSVAGSEYKSKKAKGDVKKKGKVDPYAYLPLQRCSLNKRKKLKSAGQFKNIMNAAKKGALKGAKAKKNRAK